MVSGSATVSVAPLGVSPSGFTAGLRRVFGGTPNPTGETPALPSKSNSDCFGRSLGAIRQSEDWDASALTHFESHPINRAIHIFVRIRAVNGLNVSSASERKGAMKRLALGILGSALLICPQANAAAPATLPARPRLTLDLRDGSRLIGTSVDESFSFSSEVLGEIKLPLARIRSIELPANSNSAKVMTSNGDSLATQFTTKEIRLETAFANFRVPVDLVKRIGINSSNKAVRNRPGLVALWSGALLRF